MSFRGNPVHMEQSSDFINKLSYPDFVAILGQDNTPPGGIDTVTAWVVRADIDQHSDIFDLACSTGYSSRTAAEITGCNGIGMDLSELAIRTARARAQAANLADRLEYCVGDVVGIPRTDGFFSHVLAGCSFAFVQQREAVLSEAHRILKVGGALCVANFFYFAQPPSRLLTEVEEAIGFRPDPGWTDAYWEQFFSERFVPVLDAVHDLPVMDTAVLHRQARDAVSKLEYLLGDGATRACYERLISIRSTLNEHRRYQQYSVQIWRKR